MLISPRALGALCMVLLLASVVSVAAAQPPTLTIDDVALFQDSFAQSGGVDVSTMASRDQLDVRIDSARDGLAGPGILSVDGLEGVATIGTPGTVIVSATLHYSLNMNPLFEAVIRGNAPVTDPGGGLNGWNQSEGTVTVLAPANATAFPFELDLPDDDFMYPGDVLEYYVEVEDSDANVISYPALLTGYDDPGTPFDTRFVMRALPTYFDPAGSQPTILFANNNGHGPHESPYELAMSNNTYVRGVDYDIYTVNVPDAGEPNGIGSAGSHGATTAQITGYLDVIFTAGTRTSFLLNDGTGVGGNTESDDIGLLTAWQLLTDAGRDIALFGENLPCYLAGGSPASQAYLLNHMSVSCVSDDVRPNIGGANNPSVTSSGSPFLFSPFAVGGLAVSHPFDEIDPVPVTLPATATTAHYFTVNPAESASIVYEWSVVPTVRRTLTYVFDLDAPFEILRAGTETSAAKLLAEILAVMNASPPSGVPVSSPPTSDRLFARVSVSPNPFNPSTEVRFDLTRAGSVTLRIFTLRGELVREFEPVPLEAGRHGFRWDGNDRSGHSVASAVYLAELSSGRDTVHRKLALLK